MPIWERKFKAVHFALILSVANFLLFHLPFFRFTVNNVDYKSLSGTGIVISLGILMLTLNAFIFYIVFSISKYLGKFFLILFFLLNSIAIYFANTYRIIIDESMIGNVLNTNYEESGSFLSLKLFVYLLLFGILPSIFIYKAEIVKDSIKKVLANSSLTLLFIAILVFVNSSNFLWIDKNSKYLGGLAMPWSYTVNTSLHYIHQSQKNRKEIRLPDATITDSSKSIAILVIGESARSQNFSLYGYSKNTNPLLSKISNLFPFRANASATYTSAGLKCILEHKNTGDLYEILPNYLFRNNVEVIWRSANWGEPPVHIKNYQDKNSLTKSCQGADCDYDEILLSGLKEQIDTIKKNKILIVLHASTSHGPTYSKKYPARFETFKPVCKSVELGKCSEAELINAYDNTIVYTDYLLSRTIEILKTFKNYNSTMLFVSDHGESLGENNLYMHGLPMSIAPKEQYEIPFIVWLSDNNSKQLKANSLLSQGHVFHSILNFLNVQSPIYNEDLNIFKPIK